MNVTKLSRNVVVLAFVAFLTLVVSAAGFAGMWWWVNTMDQKLHETEVRVKQIGEEQMQYASLEKLAKETANDRARLESYIVPDQGVIEFLSALEHVVRVSGASPATRSIDTQPSAEKNITENLVVSMGISGSLEAVKEAFLSIERMPYQVRIDSASMSGELGSMRADVVIIATKALPSPQ